MKIVAILIASGIALSGSLAVAQTVSAGSTTSRGDTAVSPAGRATGGDQNQASRPSPGSGVNSGVLNNGTTGDTIGTGSGSPASTASPASSPH
jgi:hypothetical protein